MKAVRLLGVGVADIVAKNRNQVDSWSLKSIYPIVELGDLGQVRNPYVSGALNASIGWPMMARRQRKLFRK